MGEIQGTSCHFLELLIGIHLHVYGFLLFWLVFTCYDFLTMKFKPGFRLPVWLAPFAHSQISSFLLLNQCWLKIAQVIERWDIQGENHLKKKEKKKRDRICSDTCDWIINKNTFANTTSISFVYARLYVVFGLFVLEFMEWIF